MAGEIELLPTRALTYVVGHDSGGLAGRSPAIQSNLSATTDPTASNDTTQGYGPGSLWQNTTTGRVFMARVTTAAAAVWNLFEISEFPGYIVGNWYVQPQIYGLSSGTAPGAGSIRLYPGYIKERVTLNSLGLRINTLAAAGNVQAAIYASSTSTARPTGNALASTASMSTAAAGNFNSAVSVQLEAGLYWWASNCDNGTAVFESIVNTAPSMNAIIGSATQNISLQGTTGVTGLSVAQTFGTWPDLTSASFTEVVASNGFPVVQFKVASVP